jgi:hypothetical protein
MADALGARVTRVRKATLLEGPALDQGAATDGGTPARAGPITVSATVELELELQGAALPSASDPEPEAEVDAEGNGVPFEPVVMGAQARFRGSEPRTVVAASQLEWERRLAPLLPPAVEIDVDWETEALVGIFLGQRNTTGFGVKLEALTLEDGVLEAAAQIAEPAPDDEVLSAVTSPFQLVRVERPEMAGAPGSLGEVETAFRALRGR